MHNITLISTRHSAIGECNLSTLNQILEAVNPEVTFEEYPKSSKKFGRNLEGTAISQYSLFHRIQRVPVDTDDMPNESFFQDHKNMLEQIEWLSDNNGANYRKYTDKHIVKVKKYGFRYLNSVECVIINDEIYNAIDKGLRTINNEKLFHTFQLWKDVNERRDDEMIRNIYNFSKMNVYENATFTIGSAHRKSIIQKIEEYEAKENFQLNWSLLSFNE